MSAYFHDFTTKPQMAQALNYSHLPQTTTTGTTTMSQVPSSDTVTLQSNQYKLQRALNLSTKALLSQYPFQAVSMALSHGPNTLVSSAGTTSPMLTQAVNDKTAFGIGSVTKTFTAAAVLKLSELGKIDLNQPITHYLEPSIIELLPTAKAISVRDLLHQTSGLPDFTRSKIFTNEILSTDSLSLTTQAIPSLLKSCQDLPFNPPHQTWEYCNTNYLLLGHILENIMQQPLENVYQNLIFRPLGLIHSLTASQLPNTTQPIALGGWKDGFDPIASVSGGAGCLYSTPLDLQVFFKALFKDKTYLSPKMLNEMTKVTSNDQSQGYGLGISNLGSDEHPIYAHNGQTFNYGAFCIYNPETDILLTGMASNKLTKDEIAQSSLSQNATPGNIPTFDQAIETTPLIKEISMVLAS
jgi:D-alanyl-D-alanine carboxypeptidase